MDFAGLIGQFRINRPLTEQEKQYQLHQAQRLDIEPHYQMSVIEMNATYLESVDKWYGDKGTITAVTLTIIGMLVALFAGLLHNSLTRETAGINGNDLGILIFAAVLFCPLIALAVWNLSKDAFSFTHYPLRFDRKQRMVHVFRKNGTVLSLPWDRIVFTMSPVDHVHKYFNILGHAMADDNVTILQSVALSVSSVGTPDGLTVLRSHWEFIRRYMEDGPAAVIGQVQFCLPIKARRESPWFGVQRLMANDAGAGVMLPVRLFNLAFSALVIPFRWIAMRTSKLPRWPAEIEAASLVEDGDPYAITGTAQGDRVSLFPAAADAAGVRFTGPPGNPLAPVASAPQHHDAPSARAAGQKKRT